MEQHSPSTKSPIEMPHDQSCLPDAPERGLTSRSCLLSLPTEIRLPIYRMLFSNLRIMLQPAQSPYRGPDAIMRTCKACYDESLPIFYGLVTIILKHETYLYVLDKKIGLSNMALIRSMVVCGFDYRISNKFAPYLPNSLQKLCIGWKAGTRSYDGEPGWEWPTSDDFISSQLDDSCRWALDSPVKVLWAKNPNLEISIEGWIGKAPSAKASQASKEQTRWVIVRVQLLNESSTNTWRFGHIKRLLDTSQIDGELDQVPGDYLCKHTISQLIK